MSFHDIASVYIWGQGGYPKNILSLDAWVRLARELAGNWIILSLPLKFSKITNRQANSFGSKVSATWTKKNTYSKQTNKQSLNWLRCGMIVGPLIYKMEVCWKICLHSMKSIFPMISDVMKEDNEKERTFQSGANQEPWR